MGSNESQAVRVSVEDLTKFCSGVFQAVGVPADEAALEAGSLVTADLRGVESHGVVRLPVYIERLAVGGTNPRPKIRVVRESRTTAVLDGDNGLGHLVGIRAMELAISKAAEGDCVFVAVRNSNHYGTASFFSEMAAEHDMIGLSFTVSGMNHMPPWGGAEAMLGNNPFSVAFPSDREFPIVLDMACSTVARGKIVLAAKDGIPIPPDWATGPDGVPTTDAEVALKGFMQPVGGAKGYALTLTVALLSTMLSGAFFGSEVHNMYNDLTTPPNIGHLFGVIPISSFEDIGHYKQRIAKAFQDLKGVKKAAGFDQIYLPGERKYLTMQKNLREGIPVNRVVFQELQEIGKRYGVPLRAASEANAG